MENSLRKGLRLLEILALSPRPLGVSALAEQAQLAPSNAHRLLKALEELQYVSQTSLRGGYQATLRLFALGEAVAGRTDIGEAAVPMLERLHALSRESAIVSVWHDGGPVIINRVESYDPARTGWRPASRIPATSTSAGMVLLAHQPPEVIARVTRAARASTSRSVTDPGELTRRLRDVRDAGFCIVEGEWQVGLTGVSVPVFRQQTPVATLTISGPATRISWDIAASLVAPLRDAARDLTEVLQGHFATRPHRST